MPSIIGRSLRQGLSLANRPHLAHGRISSGNLKVAIFKQTERLFQSTAQPKEPAGLAHARLVVDVDIPFGVDLPIPPKHDPKVILGQHLHLPPNTVPEIITSVLEQAIPAVLGKVAHPEVAHAEVEAQIVPAYFRGVKFYREPYWQKIGRWQNATEDQFLNYRWGTANDIQGKNKLYKFLMENVPERIPYDEKLSYIETREDFVADVMDGIAMAPMSIRITPHIMSSIDWSNPLADPLRRQFIPMKSTFKPDHPKVTLDSLHEQDDSPCEGLVHRYSDKCLFLASSHCPLYCRYCTRSYAVGADTATVTKASLKPKKARWEDMLSYIAATPSIQDVVVSGGDSYSLDPLHLRLIGKRLLSIDHVRRFRVATKGLCVSPSRTLDPKDGWTDELVRLARMGRERGKQVAMHTHFNHPNEFSWVSREAAQRLFAEGVVVRNQSVLLRGVNDDVDTMGALIRELADNNIQPYYVYAGDLVRGVEDLRTPLQTILDLECSIRGSIAGFMTPQFIVDLPGGGGKRLAASYLSYDQTTGVSRFVAPAVVGRDKEGKVYEYFDPLHSLDKVGQEFWAEDGEGREGKGEEVVGEM